MATAAAHAPGLDPEQVRGVSTAYLRKFLAENVVGDVSREAMTTAQVVEHVIKPMTGDRAMLAYIQEQHKDQDFVGRAELFMSHAWRYNFREAMEALLEYCAQRFHDQTHVYVWNDAFVLNQHNADESVYTSAWFRGRFRSSIRAIGRVVLVLSPWEDPVPLKRVWCLWEIFCALDLQASGTSDPVRFEVFLSHAQQKDFRAAVLRDYDTITKLMTKVDLAKAEATRDADKQAIFEAVKATVGMHELDVRLKEYFRRWCFDQLEHAVADLGGREDIAAARGHNSLGLAYKSAGLHDKAEASHAAAVRLYEVLQGPLHLDTAQSYNNWALACGAMGEHVKAIDFHRKALAVRQQVLGEEHRDTAMSYNNLALAYLSRGVYDKAREHHHKAAVIREKVLGAEHRDTAQSYNNLALAYNATAAYDQALEYHHKALATREKVLGPEDEDTAASCNNIGLVYRSMHKYRTATKYLRRGLAIREKVLGPEHPVTAQSHNNLGLVYYATRQYGQAAECHGKALAIREKVLGAAHATTATSLKHLAAVCSKLGDVDQAKRYRARAEASGEQARSAARPATAAS